MPQLTSDFRGHNSSGKPSSFSHSLLRLNRKLEDWIAFVLMYKFCTDCTNTDQNPSLMNSSDKIYHC